MPNTMCFPYVQNTTWWPQKEMWLEYHTLKLTLTQGVDANLRMLPYHTIFLIDLKSSISGLANDVSFVSGFILKGG